MAGTEDKRKESRMTEEAEQDVDRWNDQRIGERGPARAASQRVKKHEVWGDGRESPGHEAEAVHGDGCVAHAEGTIPSHNAQEDFGSDFCGNGYCEVLNCG